MRPENGRSAAAWPLGIALLLATAAAQAKLLPLHLLGDAAIAAAVNDQSQASIAAGAGNGSVQLVWSEVAGGGGEVFAQRIGAGNEAGEQRTLSLGPPAQLHPDVVRTSLGWTIIYRSSTASGHRILAHPLDPSGVPLGTQPLELDGAASLSYPSAPTTAWNGAVPLAAWGTANGVVARRLAADGTPLDPAPFQVLASSFGPVDVAALGDRFLVVGLRCGINCQYVFPVAARVAGDGSVLEPTPIALGVTFASTPRVAALGGRWLVVWRDNASHDDPYATTLAARVDAAGVEAPQFVVHGPHSSVGGSGIFTLGLASNGTAALVVPSQELTSGVETDLVARRVAADGTVSPSTNLTPWAGDQYRPRASWDGELFVVVWQDQRAAFDGEWGLELLDARSDLFGMRVTAAGAIVDPQGFPISNSALGEAFPDLAGSAGASLVAASTVLHDAAHAGYRIGYALYGADGNRWPVARASATPAAGTVPVTVDFDSAGSADPDGSIASRLWRFGDGATSIEANPSHTYLDGGPFVATLELTDDRGAGSALELLLELSAPNLPPVAAATADRTAGAAPLDVVFRAAGSNDPDGWIGNVRWQFGDGWEAWGATADHTYSASGLAAIAFTSDWIQLTWSDNSASEDGFTVERCAGSTSSCSASPAQFAPIATTATNIDSHADTGLPAGSTFTYRVRAFNVSGVSADSNLATATTLGGAVPAAPTGLTAVAGATGAGWKRRIYADLAWIDNATDETSYVVERCPGSTCTGFAPVATLAADGRGFRDLGLQAKRTYRYRVRARNAAGDSPPSGIASVTTR